MHVAQQAQAVGEAHMLQANILPILMQHFSHHNLATSNATYKCPLIQK